MYTKFRKDILYADRYNIQQVVWSPYIGYMGVKRSIDAIASIFETRVHYYQKKMLSY